MDKQRKGLISPHNLLNSWVIFFIIAICAVFSYFNGVKGDFVFDDIPLVQIDPFYTDDNTSWLDCWNRTYWPEGMDIKQHRPLTLLSFLINTRIAQLYYQEYPPYKNNALPDHFSPIFRLLNLILHLIITLLVFNLAIKLRYGRVFAIFAALIFAVHPIHTEAVIPAFGRAELLCAIFIILGLISHISSYEKPKQWIASKIPSWGFNILTGFCFLLACWAKENGVILLPLCLLYDVFFRIKFESFCYIGKSDKCGFECPICLLIKKYWFFVLALGLVILTRVIGTGSLIPYLRKSTGIGVDIDNPLIGAPIITRILTAFHVQGMVIYKFFWPQVLSHDYSYKQIVPIETINDPFAILAILCFFIIPVILCFLIPRRKKTILFFWMAYIVSILPAGNFITPTGTIFGERLYYTPSIWLIFITLFLLFNLSKYLKPKIPLIRISIYSILIIFIFTSMFRVYIRTEDFKNPYNLRLSAVQSSPRSVKSWNNLGMSYRVKGEEWKAVAAFTTALDIIPDYKSALTNRANCWFHLKQYNKAENDLRHIIKIGTCDPEIYNKLAGIELKKTNAKKRLSEAIRLLKKSLKLKPEQAQIKNILNQLEKDIKLKNSN